MRVMPPEDGLHPSIAVLGQTYTCATGSVLDVPDHVGALMLHNGWTAAANGGGAGATAARPATPAKRQQYHDTTLGYTIIWDGKAWRNPATGAAV